MVRSSAALLVLLTFPVSGIGAQDRSAPPTFSAAFGVVADSIHGGPLIGAVVRVSETNRRAVTDNKGYYRIDSIPPGPHRLSLHHPLLDTIGMEIGTQPIHFPAGQVPVVPLGTPSGEAMLQIACPKVTNPEGPVGLLGVVKDPDTGRPAIGALVTLRWTEVRVSKEAGVRRSNRVRTAVADSAGNYAICGLPGELGGAVQATLNGASTASVDIWIDDVSIVALRSLSLGASEPVTDTVDGVARTLRRGPATLRGRVLGPDGGGLAGARVEVAGSPQSVVTSPTGAFSLAQLPAGTQALVVRGVGYRQSSSIVELSAKQTREVTVTLSSVQVLPTIETQVAATGLDRVGFTERKRFGMGRYVTREQIERRNPMVVTDLFTTVPGVRVEIDRNGNRVLASSRSVPGDASGCVAVFVDRMQMFPPFPDQLVSHLNSMVPTDQVWAIEIYQPSQVPSEFTRSSQRCLTFVVWTRFGVGNPPNPAP